MKYTNEEKKKLIDYTIETLETTKKALKNKPIPGKIDILKELDERIECFKQISEDYNALPHSKRLIRE
jgi:hypothetical protein